MINQSELWMDKTVCADAVLRFLDKCPGSTTALHAMQIYRHGKLMLSMAPKPYSVSDTMQLYSLSKSFSSTAIGFLADDGVLTAEDRVIDIFKDQLPARLGCNMEHLKVKHLLSMNTGHAVCCLPYIRRAAAPVTEFLNTDLDFMPGTHFTYNNAATYMLSEIVTHYTKKTMFDFLQERLFLPLGITDVYWDVFPSGRSQGAVGLHASVEDAAKLGLLYLNKGKWNGKQLLSEKWVAAASAPHSDNSDNGAKDWSSGYGYQFWRNAKEGYRGDGAFGQLSMVFPERDMVVATKVCCHDMQTEIDLIYDLMDALCEKSVTTEADVLEKLDQYYPVPDSKPISEDLCGRLYHCTPNILGITSLTFHRSADGICAAFSDGSRLQTMHFGIGSYQKSEITVKRLKPTLETLAGTDAPEAIAFAAAAEGRENGFTVSLYYLDNPHYETWEFYTDKDNSKVSWMRNGVTLAEGFLK